MTEILGRSHAVIRRIRALGRDASARRAESIVLAEGLHLAREALEAGVRIELCVASPRLERSPDGAALLEAIGRRSIRCVFTTDAILDSLQDARSAQPLLTLLERPAWPDDAGLEGSRSAAALIVVAVGVQDPGNLGAMIRTAEAAGVGAFHACAGCADRFHPRAVRASMGSALRLPSFDSAVDALIERLRERGIGLIGTDPRRGTPYHQNDFSGPCAVFFGSEGRGLAPEAQRRMDLHVHVPLQRVESLSVGAAVAVVLFEAARQRSVQSSER